MPERNWDAFLNKGKVAEPLPPLPAPVKRAMGNLRQALHDLLGRGDLSHEAVLDLATLIDEVAQKVERLG